MSVTVFVFLLDSLPGFENILNTMLQETTGGDIKSLSQCDPFYEDIVWIDIIKNNIIDVDEEKHGDKAYGPNRAHDEEDSPIQDIKAYKDIESEINVHNIHDTFLVSIFETVLNITAQTCGGTLLSPHWVITAATCVDLLSHIYKKNLNFNQTHYSVIVNAVDPLTDGSVHNVSEILLNPTSHKNSGINDASRFNSNGIKIPSLALLKIEPPINGMFIDFSVEKIRPNIEVIVYGWILNKDPTSGQDKLSMATVKAITVESNDCKANYSFIDETSLICLSPCNKNDVNIRMMNSGGPVIISLENKIVMAAVAQLDTHSNFVAYLLHCHYSWIMEVINKY